MRRAKAHPERDFLGIEWASKIYRYAVDRMRRWQIPNVRMTRTDASRFIIEQCPRDSLSVLHIYHPDPWPKKRHHRRRLIQTTFVDAAASCLTVGGRLAIQTDHAEYFEHIAAVTTAQPHLRQVPFDDAAFGVEQARIATNYEIKYLREGRAIYQLAFERVD